MSGSKLREATTPVRYCVAAAAVVIGLALRLILVRLLGTSVPYITFFPAVMFSAWFGGVGPGIFSSILTLIVFAALEGIVPFQHPNATNVISGLLFVGVSAFISLLTEELRRSRHRSEQNLHQLQRALAASNDAEKALAENRDLLRTTLASLGDSVITTDAQGNVSFLNPPAERLTGWSLAEAQGHPISEVFVVLNEQTRLAVENPARRALKEGCVVSLANHSILLSQDGRETPIEDSAAPIRDELSRLFGAVLVFRDISQRRASELALRKSEESLKLALMAGQIGVWDWDVANERVTWSDRMYEIHGLKKGAFQEGIEQFLKLVHPDDRQAIRQSMRDSMEGIPPIDFQFRIVLPDGGIRWASTTAILFKNEKEEIVRVLGATTDITKSKRAEEDLKLINRNLLSANRNLEEFTEVASHDLQEPLRMVNIYTQLLLKRLGDQDAEINQYARVLTEGVGRMQALLHDLLEYSRASNVEVADSSADLSAALNEALTTLQNDIRETGAIIHSSPLPVTMGETTQLSHVFQNLLSNAIKYRKSGMRPEISISARLDGAEWVISVEDKGIGFHQQYAGQIFGLFKRLHSREYPGTGLGLAICQRIVERVGGRIWAEGVLGTGSTFYFALPAIPSSTREVTSAS